MEGQRSIESEIEYSKPIVFHYVSHARISDGVVWTVKMTNTALS